MHKCSTVWRFVLVVRDTKVVVSDRDPEVVRRREPFARARAQEIRSGVVDLWDAASIREYVIRPEDPLEGLYIQPLDTSPLLPVCGPADEAWCSFLLGCPCKHEDCLSLRAAIRVHSSWRDREPPLVSGWGPSAKWTGKVAPRSKDGRSSSFLRAEKKALEGDGIVHFNYMGDASWASPDELYELFHWILARAKPGLTYVFSTCRPQSLLNKLGSLVRTDWPEIMGIEVSARTIRKARDALEALKKYPCRHKVLRLQPWSGDLQEAEHVDLGDVLMIVLEGHVGHPVLNIEQFEIQARRWLSLCVQQQVPCDFKNAGGPNIKQGLKIRDAMITRWQQA